MYKEYDNLDLVQIDKEINAFWEEQDIFRKSISERDPDNAFVFYEGPPSANGKPGIHHVLARTVKDLFCRYRTMKGQRVERKGGWDTHGLPVELKVEKELGITKDDIGEKISIEEYNAKCKETVMRYKDLWDDITRKMGYWVDLDDPYITFKSEYIESVWNILKTLHDQGLMYKGYTIQPYSPAAGTGLSTHELNQPGCYREVKDTSVTAQFKVERNEASDYLFQGIGEGDVFLLAWTTTPWTLPSNTALGVNPNLTYALVKTYNPYTDERVHVVLAEELLDEWLEGEQDEEAFRNWTPDEEGPIPWMLANTFSGDKLEGIRYEQLLPYAQPEDGDAFLVISGDFVTTEEGTGIVHLAPSFGADDKRMADKFGLGALTLVDKHGQFTEEMGKYAGRYVKNYTDDPDWENPDIDIAVDLKKSNRAFDVQKYAHNYPHCWRTDKPVLYYPLDSWFVETTARKERMVELNNTINWKPAHTGEKRFGHWLENLQDWNLSRSRFWGIPLPIWRTEDGEQEKCIGSIEELSDEIQQANRELNMDQDIPDDLHRPFIDEVVLVSDDGQPMQRETDLIDVWFDSGSMPYAQWHYPFENKEVFERNYPADFIAEGVDQTRGWFFTLHAIATMAFDSVAYKNVVSNGLVQDKHGRKMSKRLGNAVEPFETLAEYGADATRWYMISNAQPWDNLKFDVEGILEVQRKFFGTLYNTYSFFALYANIDGFSYSEEEVPIDKRPQIDRWILSRLHSLIEEVDGYYSEYEPTLAARAIQEFVDEHLSNWYVRLCRRRFWKGEYTEDKVSAYQTLYDNLEAIAKLMAPLAPFFGDWLYKNLNDQTEKEPHQSVHLSHIPTVRKEWINKDLEKKMDYAQRISSLALSLRKKEQIRVRQPLKKILLPILDDQFERQVRDVEDLILQEVNVKRIEYVDDASGIIEKKAKPNYRNLGSRLGKDMKDGANRIESLDQQAIEQFEEADRIELEINGTKYELSGDDILIEAEDIPGWMVANDGALTVALDVRLDDVLKAEGLAREIVNRIQKLRKEKEYEVTDRIRINIEQKEDILPAIEHFSDYIKREVLADQLDVTEEVDGETVELIDDISLELEIERVAD